LTYIGKNAYDEFMPEAAKEELFDKLQNALKRQQKGPALFISATKRINIDELKIILLRKVIEHYQIRYPYKHNFY